MYLSFQQHVHVFDSLIWPNETPPIGLHDAMFLPSIRGQCTAEQKEKWLGPAERHEILGTYAESYGAKDGWHFLSGSVKNVNTITRKLGKYVEHREDHDTIILIGNLKTKLWKKANGLAGAPEIIKVLDSVIADVGDTE